MFLLLIRKTSMALRAAVSFAFILSSHVALAQRDAVYLQLGGNGILFSGNYERGLSSQLPLTLHAGVGIYGLRETVLTVPLGARYAVPLKGRNWLDIGAGATWTSADPMLYTTAKRPEGYVPYGGWNFVPSLGYRHRGARNGFVRVGFTPVINRYGLIPSVEFSVGRVLADWRGR